MRQLQGYEIAASAWEPEILFRRIAKYKPEFLDEICFSGEVMWGRLSAHPAFADNRRVRPTRIALVSLFLREDAGWLMDAPPSVESRVRSLIRRRISWPCSNATAQASFRTSCVRRAASPAKSKTGSGN